MSQNPNVVDMENFDLDESLEELAKRRYAMPPVVIAALRQAGNKATARLLKMVEDDSIFDKLAPKDQLRLIEVVMDRAYGKSETAAGHDLTQARLNGDPSKNSDHAKQLDELKKREARISNSQVGGQRGRHALPKPTPSDDDVLRQVDSMRNRPVPPTGKIVDLRRPSRNNG